MNKILNLNLYSGFNVVLNTISKSLFSTSTLFLKNKNLINIRPEYEPEIHPNCMKNNRMKYLPKEYVEMMQVVLPRIAQHKRINRISMDIRRNKFSLESRLATAEGRRILLRRIIKGRCPPTPFHE